MSYKKEDLKCEINAFWMQEAGKFNNILDNDNSKSTVNFVANFQKARINKILDFAGNISVKGSKMVDLGCGGGQLALIFANVGMEVTGVDFSQPMLDIAEKRFQGIKGKHKFILSEANNTKLPGKSFDVALAIGLLDYVDNISLYFAEMNRLLKDDGIAIISIPSKYSPLFLLRTGVGNMLRKKYLHSPPILQYLSKIECINLIRKFGFEILLYENVYSTMHLFKVKKLFEHVRTPETDAYGNNLNG